MDLQTFIYYFFLILVFVLAYVPWRVPRIFLSKVSIEFSFAFLHVKAEITFMSYLQYVLSFVPS